MFRLDWKKSEQSLSEFEQMLRAVFQGAAKYIKLKLVKDGSVIMVCECPEFMEGCLARLVKEQTDLLCSFGVMGITIGDTVVMVQEVLYCHC